MPFITAAIHLNFLADVSARRASMTVAGANSRRIQPKVADHYVVFCTGWPKRAGKFDARWIPPPSGARFSLSHEPEEHRTPNIEWQRESSLTSAFDVRCSMLDVRCFPSVQGFQRANVHFEEISLPQGALPLNYRSWRRFCLARATAFQKLNAIA